MISPLVRRSSLAVASAGLVTLLLAGCTAEIQHGVEDLSNGHVREVSYATGTEGLDSDDLTIPSWIPEEATEITEKIRTTGSERIMRLHLDAADLADVCTPWPSDTPPKRAARTVDGQPDIEYRSSATLEAEWWKPSAEQHATFVCDDEWWVTIDHDWVYAFSPERTNTVIETPEG